MPFNTKKILNCCENLQKEARVGPKFENYFKNIYRLKIFGIGPSKISEIVFKLLLFFWKNWQKFLKKCQQVRNKQLSLSLQCYSALLCVFKFKVEIIQLENYLRCDKMLKYNGLFTLAVDYNTADCYVSTEIKHFNFPLFVFTGLGTLVNAPWS